MNDGTGLQYFPSTSSGHRLTDHLGSVVATTDSAGTLISQQRYLPFGGVRADVPSTNVPSTDYGYTGQRNLDPEIGLMDYKARFYSPYLNHFIQPDSLTPGGPQGLNRYSYVNNSPINYNDPTGHMCSDPEDQWGNGCDGSGGLPLPNSGGGGSGNGSGGSSGGGGGGGGDDPDPSDGEDGLLGPPAPTYGDGLIGPPDPCAIQSCWGVPDYWDLDPTHADYRSSVYNVYFINVAYTTDRYEQNYLSIGVSFNIKSILPLGYSYVIGAPSSLFDNKITNINDINTFLTGPSINLTGGLLTGGGTTLSPGVLIKNGYSSDLKPSSMETGLYLIGSLGITGSWGFSLDR